MVVHCGLDEGLDLKVLRCWAFTSLSGGFAGCSTFAIVICCSCTIVLLSAKWS